MHVAEVLRHGECGQGNTQTGAGWLIHLAEYKCGLGDNPRLGHFEEEVVAFTGALPHTGEHRYATEVLGNPVNHFLDENRLADTGPTEQADFSTLYIRSE